MTTAPATTDAMTYRKAMGLFPTGVALITAGTGDAAEAVTVNSLTSISLDPMLLLISIRWDGKIRTKIENVGGFCVNILSEEQMPLSVSFAKKDRPTGAAVTRYLGGATGGSGSLLVPEALACLECGLETQYQGGDHILFLGGVTAIHLGDPERRPLLTHQGQYVPFAAIPTPNGA